MSGKNFDLLEVGAWYRLRRGFIGQCGENTSTDENARKAYPFVVNVQGTCFVVSRQGKCIGNSKYDVVERVANKNGDPWPEVKTEPRQFKIGDVVRVKLNVDIDRYVKQQITQPQHAREKRLAIGREFQVGQIGGPLVSLDRGKGQVMWDFFPEDLTLIKPVDEDQKDAAQAESINQDQCCSECCCDASGVEASFESSVVDGSGLEITYKLAPIEFACKCGDVSLRFDYSNPNAIEVKGGSMSFEVARESLESLVTCLTCLRDELRLKRGVDECGAIQTVVR